MPWLCSRRRRSLVLRQSPKICNTMAGRRVSRHVTGPAYVEKPVSVVFAHLTAALPASTT